MCIKETIRLPLLVFSLPPLSSARLRLRLFAALSGRKRTAKLRAIRVTLGSYLRNKGELGSGVNRPGRRDNGMLRNNSMLLIVVFTVLCLLSFWSVTRTLVERWNVLVLDTSDRPVKGIRVSESCDDYSIDWRDGGDRFTDEHGKVTFPKCSLTATRFYWAVVPILNRLNVHSSSGISAIVSVSDLKSLDSATTQCANEECSRRPMYSVLRIRLRSEVP